MSYFDIYKKRVNRFGTNYQERVQNQREYEFENYYLIRSVYRIDFKYDNTLFPGSFEPYKQDETETLHYLLTQIDCNIPNGTILMLPDKDKVLHPWMVYWLENLKASGYNRYILLKMTHYIHWVNKNGIGSDFYAYLYSQEDNMLKDQLMAKSRSNVVYNENLKLSFFITSANENIQKDDYFEITTRLHENTEKQIDVAQGYRVTGYDIVSTPGVEYVSVELQFRLDNSPLPVPSKKSDDEDEYFWLKSGEFHPVEKKEG